MANLSTTDILDTMLSSLAVDKDFTNVDLWLVDFAHGQNVAEDDIKTDPLPFKVERMMLFWVMCEICRRNLGKNISTNAAGYDTDWYEKKLKEYKKELDAAISLCTARVLMGEEDEYDDNTESSTEIERG